METKTKTWYYISIWKKIRIYRKVQVFADFRGVPAEFAFCPGRDPAKITAVSHVPEARKEAGRFP